MPSNKPMEPTGASLGASTKLQKFACETAPGPLPAVAAQQAFPSHDRREWYDANFRNLVLVAIVSAPAARCASR